MSSSNPKGFAISAVPRTSTALQALACALALLHAAPGASQDHSSDAWHGLSGSRGTGAVSTTICEGSANRRNLVGPDFSVSPRAKGKRRVDLGRVEAAG